VSLSCFGSPMEQPPTETPATKDGRPIGVEIRRALPTDADSLARLRFAFRLERRPATQDLNAFAARCSDWMHSRLHDGSRWTAWLAERDGRIVGTLWVQIIEKLPNPGAESEVHAYISNFFIVPEARNVGVGTRLLHAAVAHCKAHGVDNVFLWPSERSIPLYHRAGFESPTNLLALNLGGEK